MVAQILSQRLLAQRCHCRGLHVSVLREGRLARGVSQPARRLCSKTHCRLVCVGGTSRPRRIDRYGVRFYRDRSPCGRVTRTVDNVDDANHEFEGDFETLRDGFAAIGMPPERWTDASAIVREVLEANDAVGFRWYKPDRTDELACTWAGVGQNALWIGTNNVHVSTATAGIRLPPRTRTYSKQNGAIGWLLPGASAGSGGGRRSPTTRWVACPVTQELQLGGSECPDCMTVHEC